jgi:hypothetical protein
LQRLIAAAEQQRLAEEALAKAADALERRVLVAEHAAAVERLNVSEANSVEKDRRMLASLARKVALNAARITDPVGLNMARAPSGKDLDNFEHDPVQSVLMMHSIFGNDFLLTPPPRDMSEPEEQEYKDALYEQCALSEETMQKCITDYKNEMSSDR